MEIRLYNKAQDEERLMQLIEEEGEEWADYWAPEAAEKFKLALEQSLTHVAYQGEKLCGFTRSLDDCGFNILLMDLLVAPDHRGKNIGRQFIERICRDYPQHEVYVLSDNNDYYEHQGFSMIGTVFALRSGSPSAR